MIYIVAYHWGIQINKISCFPELLTLAYIYDYKTTDIYTFYDTWQNLHFGIYVPRPPAVDAWNLG